MTTRRKLRWMLAIIADNLSAIATPYACALLNHDYRWSPDDADDYCRRCGHPLRESQGHFSEGKFLEHYGPEHTPFGFIIMPTGRLWYYRLAEPEDYILARDRARRAWRRKNLWRSC